MDYRKLVYPGARECVNRADHLAVAVYNCVVGRVEPRTYAPIGLHDARDTAIVDVKKNRIPTIRRCRRCQRQGMMTGVTVR